MFKRIVSLFLCFAIVFVLYFPAFAVDEPQQMTFWSYIGSLVDGDSSFGGPVQYFQQIIDSIKSPGECPNSPTSYHSWNFTHPVALLTGYLDWECDYCHAHYSDYCNAGEQDYLTTNNLNNMTVTSTGGLYWQPTLDDVVFLQSYHYNHVLIDKQHNPPITLPNNEDTNEDTQVYYFNDLTVSRTYIGSSPFVSEGIIGIKFIAPYSGSYRVLANTVVFCDGVVSLYDGSTRSFNGYVLSDSQSIAGSSGDILYLHWDLQNFSNYPERQYTGQFVIPLIYCETHSISTPSIPSSITVNNTTYTVNSFDFTERIFNVTNNDGDDITITYGDDNYTVTNNTTNVTNNYYYYITNNNSEDPTGSGGSGSSGGSGTDYTSILTQIKDLCSQILEKIGVGGGSLPESTPLPELTQEESSQSFLGTFLAKFGFVTQVYNIVAQMAADVTNDAVTAQAVADGIIPVGVITSSHVSTDDSGDVSSGDYSSGVVSTSIEQSVSSPAMLGQATAPEILTRFGSNDLIDLSEYSAIDMSWYAPYKSDVDAILSGFMWLGYIWLLFKRLPSIVRGGAMAANDMNNIGMSISNNVDKQSKL